MRIIFACFVVLMLMACNTGLPLNLSQDLMAPSGHSVYLAEEYEALALSEKDGGQGTEKSTVFQEKADQAKQGKKVGLETPDAERFPEQGDADELLYAAEMFDDALKNMDSAENYHAIAVAQVHYDCWLVNLADEEKARAKDCRKGFYDAMAELRLPEEKKQAFSVYFDTGMVELHSEGMETVRKAAGFFQNRDHWVIVLTGYTDSKGDVYSNRTLSMRRAIAVRNALIQQGVGVKKIAVRAQGEVRASDEVENEAELRKVEISFRPEYVVPAASGKNTQAMGWSHTGNDL